MLNKPNMKPDSSKMDALKKLKELAMELMGEKIKGKVMPSAVAVKIEEHHPANDFSEMEDPSEEAQESPADEAHEDAVPALEPESDLDKLKKLLKKK